jgi:hypothetical protein
VQSCRSTHCAFAVNFLAAATQNTTTAIECRSNEQGDAERRSDKNAKGEPNTDEPEDLQPPHVRVPLSESSEFASRSSEDFGLVLI